MSEEIVNTEQGFAGEGYGEAWDNLAMMRPRPDGTLDPAGEAGWFLQREREMRGETLEQAGEATGIHPYHIEAIEFGDMTRMPARMEALEMIGIYAQYLGFDPEPLVIHYAQFLPRPAVAPKAVHPANPAPLSSAKILKFGKMPKLPKFSFNVTGLPGGPGGLVAGIAGAVFVFAGIAYVAVPGDVPTEPQVAEIADTMPTASTGPEEAEIAITEEELPDDTATTPEPKIAAGEQAAGTNPDSIAALIEQNAGDTPAANAIPQPLEVTASMDMEQTPEGRVFGAKTGGDRLILRAKAPVWVRIEDTAGNVVMTQMLAKGDSYRVPDREGLVVIARDGGLLSYVIDGEEKGVLGTPGEILVGRSLDLKALQSQG